MMKTMQKGNKKLNPAEKISVVLSMGALCAALMLGYREYALGVALAVPAALLLYHWQMKAVDNRGGLSPQRATINLVIRSTLRHLIFLGMAGLSLLGGKPFFFGVVTGLLLQIMAFAGQAFFIISGKEG